VPGSQRNERGAPMNESTSPTAPRARTEPLPTTGLVLLVALTLIWGFNWPVMKVALAELSPWTFRAICTLGGSVGLYILCKLGDIPLTVPRGRRRALVVVSFFNITGWTLPSAYAVSLMPAGRASIIAFTMPVWVVLFGALFLGERTTTRRLLALGLGLGGLGVLIGSDLAAVGKAPIGALLMCWAAMSWALGTVILKRVVWNAPVIALTVWQLAIGGLPIMVVASFHGFGDLFSAGTIALLGLLYNVVVCFIFGNYAWFKIVSLFPAAIAGISSLMIPVIGVFSSAAFLGEPLGFQEIGALVLVLSALGVVLGSRTRDAARRK
jgi:drug/metabolite transporter (DMT)-like permease